MPVNFIRIVFLITISLLPSQTINARIRSNDTYIIQRFWQNYFLDKIKVAKLKLKNEALQKKERSFFEKIITIFSSSNDETNNGEPSISAWGLFSYGGWGDDGQIFIIKKNSMFDVYTADSGGMALIQGKDLSKFITYKQIKSEDTEFDYFNKTLKKINLLTTKMSDS
jgi:hypothetical protein